jgi:hypothetical protein
MTKPRVKSFTYVACKKYDGMMGRCYRETESSYKNYGGKGIRVCSAWIKDIEAFKLWLLKELETVGVPVEEFVKNSHKYTLDRKDGLQHYTPSNCRIVSPQANTRNSVKGRDRVLTPAEGEEIKFFDNN